MTPSRRLATITIAALACAAAPVPRGHPATVDIENATAAPLECHALAGRWYGFDLGRVGAASHRRVAVLFDRVSGVVAMPNAQGQPIPLQFVYCGQPSDAWRTRAVLPLRQALRRPAPIVCRADVAPLHCTAD